MKLLLDKANKQTYSPLMKDPINKHKVANIQKITLKQNGSSLVHASSRDHESMFGAQTFALPSDSERNIKQLYVNTELAMGFDARMQTMPICSASGFTDEQQGSVEEMMQRGELNVVALTSARQLEPRQAYATSRTEDSPGFFDDSLEKFVQVLKHATNAIEINIFSLDLVQVYSDPQFSAVRLNTSQSAHFHE